MIGEEIKVHGEVWTREEVSQLIRERNLYRDALIRIRAGCLNAQTIAAEPMVNGHRLLEVQLNGEAIGKVLFKYQSDETWPIMRELAQTYSLIISRP